MLIKPAATNKQPMNVFVILTTKVSNLNAAICNGSAMIKVMLVSVSGFTRQEAHNKIDCGLES